MYCNGKCHGTGYILTGYILNIYTRETNICPCKNTCPCKNVNNYSWKKNGFGDYYLHYNKSYI